MLKRDRIKHKEQASEAEIERLLLDNEVKSNLLMLKINFIFALIVFVYIFLLSFNIFGVENTDTIHIIFLWIMFGINAGNCIITFLHKGKGKSLMYITLFLFILSVSICNLIYSYLVQIVMLIPVVLSSRYFNKKFTAIVSIATGIMWFISTYIGELFGIAWVDLNFYEMAEGSIITVKPPSLYDSIVAYGINTELRMLYLWNRFYVELTFFVVVTIISMGIAECGRRLINRMASERLDKMRLSTELHVATNIQLDMLPNSSDVPPKNDEFELAALMDPAKEVGGDFYDFFYIDEEHLALVIADVSGKGIPAALFMAKAKTTIKSIALNDDKKSTSSILKNANEELCKNNDEGFFVTVWMGIINIKTGKGIATNAGHERPLVKRNMKSYELIEHRHSMPLGAFEGSNFENHEFNLNKGDILIVYTDGVPESMNNEKEQFGEQRMLFTLNNIKDEISDVTDITLKLKEATKIFAAGAEQADDLSILCYKQKV